MLMMMKLCFLKAMNERRRESGTVALAERGVDK